MHNANAAIIEKNRPLKSVVTEKKEQLFQINTVQSSVNKVIV